MPGRRRLFVVYIPGFDRRRVNPCVTPFAHRALEVYPHARLWSQPSSGMLPSFLTGTNPHAHQIWQVSLRKPNDRRRIDAVLDRLPDSITTTWHCIRHVADASSDLPAVPRRRRRRFVQHRFKYRLSVDTIGGVPSIFHLLGRQARFRPLLNFRGLSTIADTPPDDRYGLDFLDLHGFVYYCHWHLVRPAAVERKFRLVDRFLERLHRNCERKGWTLALLVPHGQERVQNSINMRKLLATSGASSDEFDYFLEVAIARFWFATDRARQAVTDALAANAHIRLVQNRDLRLYDIRFPDDRFGDLYAIAEHGYIYFPHDFYHPIGNLVLGLTHTTMRPRIWNPRHRGYHGQLPDHPAEEGFLIVFDAALEAENDTMKLVDFAPTILSLLGQDQPEYMEGRSILSPRRGAADHASA